jgi:DNA polymerase-3 subunit epsilon
VPTKNIFHCYLNPERKISEEALKIHGYSDEFLENKVKFIEIADKFLNFIGDKNLIIHNASFDLSHLNNELQIIGKKSINISRVVDTLEIAREKFPGSQISLDALCKKFRIDSSKREKHSAVKDCELLAKVYVNLMDEKEPSLDFSGDKILKYAKQKQNVIIKYSKKIVKPTAEEIKLHKDFLKKELKKNYFN